MNACDGCHRELGEREGAFCTLCGEEYERLLAERHEEYWRG